jgi:PAS domain S-box-containing protein
MLNSTAVSALEYQSEELCGRHLSLILPGHLKEFDRRDLPTQLSECKSASVTRKSGEKFPADISFKQIAVDGEEKVLIAVQDVSERYAVEMLKRQFTAMISHDIRAPLSSVRMLLELFGSGQSSEKLQGLANRAVGEIDRLAALTTDLMDFETANQGKFSLYLSEINISSVLEAAFHAVRQLAESQGISIELNLCDASCEADHRRLVQVLVNLLSNAIKYSPRGQKVVVTASKANNQITVSVKDQGRGVPAEKAKKIFEPYSQSEKADATIGTGLGLAICKGIIEQHGGTIGVDSSADSGSKFWFCIPERQADSQR